jgi:hypothetical protein
MLMVRAKNALHSMIENEKKAQIGKCEYSPEQALQITMS